MQETKSTRSTRRMLYGALALLAVILTILSGCYPGEVNSVAEVDLVTTLYDKQADFSALRTFAMPDSIIHICDVPEEDQNCPSELTRRYDTEILRQVRQNMVAAGFTEVQNPQQADALVLVAANAVDNYGYAYYGWYWDYWYGYPPGMGWYYPGYYPGYAVPYEFTTGTIFIGMFDPAKADSTNQRLGAVWLAGLNGLLGEGGTPQTRITTTVNQAFQQSPYLGAGK